MSGDSLAAGTVAAGLAERAAALDAADPLAWVRNEFLLPEGIAYLDGNSLGPPLRSVPARVDDVVRRQWGELLIRSWDASGWWAAPGRVGDRIAPLLGAAPGQVVVTDSTTTNVFKVLTAALRQAAPRDELVLDATTFPTDGYVAESVARLTGATLVRVAPDDLAGALTERTAAVLLNHVDYRTGRLHDMAAFTATCHDAGALAVWDVSHSVGVLPLELDRLGVDLAVGATYKFLNGGPGAPSFVYVPSRAQAGLDQPLTGWSGAADPFAMDAAYRPAAGIDRVRTGTPDIVSLLTLDAALDIWDHVDLATVRAKGLALTDFFIESVDALLDPGQIAVVTPRGHDRGHHVALEALVSGPASAPAHGDPDTRKDGAAGLVAALAAAGVLADHRPPSLLRFGFAPLYVTYADALRAVTTLADLLARS